MKKAEGLRRVILISALIFTLALLTLFFIRMFSEKHLDDVSPGIQCDEELLRKAEVYYVIPIFNGEKISEDREWCEKIKGYEKRLAMHGVYHEYLEFETLRNESYVQEGANVFKECFGYAPEEFKAPQLAISKENLKM